MKKLTLLLLLCSISFASCKSVYAFPNLFGKNINKDDDKFDKLDKLNKNIKISRMVESETSNFLALTKQASYISKKIENLYRALENNVEEYDRLTNSYNKQKNNLNKVYKSINLSMKKINNLIKYENEKDIIITPKKISQQKDIDL